MPQTSLKKLINTFGLPLKFRHTINGISHEMIAESIHEEFADCGSNGIFPGGTRHLMSLEQEVFYVATPRLTALQGGKRE